MIQKTFAEQLRLYEDPIFMTNDIIGIMYSQIIDFIENAAYLGDNWISLPQEYFILFTKNLSDEQKEMVKQELETKLKEFGLNIKPDNFGYIVFWCNDINSNGFVQKMREIIEKRKTNNEFGALIAERLCEDIIRIAKTDALKNSANKYFYSMSFLEERVELITKMKDNKELLKWVLSSLCLKLTNMGFYVQEENGLVISWENCESDNSVAWKIKELTLLDNSTRITKICKKLIEIIKSISNFLAKNGKHEYNLEFNHFYDYFNNTLKSSAQKRKITHYFCEKLRENGFRIEIKNSVEKSENSHFTITW